MEKQRIEYIDLAKGICIILVVINHMCGVLGLEPTIWSDLAMTFRMPLYFILSGLFFSTYSGHREFIVKKTNKLLIPFIFFSVIGFIISRIKSILLHDVSSLSDHLISGLYYENIGDTPIWFLLCLYLCGIFFYWISIIANHSKSPVIISSLLASILGIFGFMLGKYHINLPFWFDSALTALPFYAFGFFLRKNTSFLEYDVGKLKLICMAILLMAMTFCCRCYSRIDLNDMSKANIIEYYFSGLTGTLSILLFSKCFNRIPWISYFGRYSICILVSHIYIVVAVKLLLMICHIDVSSRLIGNIICVPIMGLYLFAIPLMIKYLPHVCAQKDLIKYKSKGNNA